jgi:hypothetical protein
MSFSRLGYENIKASRSPSDFDFFFSLIVSADVSGKESELGALSTKSTILNSRPSTRMIFIFKRFSFSNLCS